MEACTSLVVCCLLLSANGDADRARQVAELRAIKKRIIADLTFGEFVRTSRAYRDGVSRLDERVDELLAIRPGYWTRYDRISHPSISHHARATAEPLALAIAYAKPSSRHHHSEPVLRAIEDALKHFRQFIYRGCPQKGNWWAWRIGVPMRLIPTLILLEGRLAPDLRDHYVEAVRYLLKVEQDVAMNGPYRPSGSRPVGKTDTNALWANRLRFEYAVLIENPAMAGKWASKTFGEVGPAGKGHLQADYSFKFHGPIPMWAYGRSFLIDYARLIDCYGKTTFGPTRRELERFGEMALHYANGFLYKSRICPAIIGREISRGDATFACPAGLLATSAIARSDHPQARQFARLALRACRSAAAVPMLTSRVPAARRNLPDVEPAPPVRDIFAYPDADFIQITRPTWSVGIKMHSKRNRGYESINEENLQGWFLSHGSMFHFITGNEWNGCWPTLDWTRLPGTTVAAAVKKQSRSPFVGVLRASPEIATAAMALRRDGFAARKSWLVNEDHIVCVGSGIVGPGRVETTVLNLPVSENTPLLIDGKPAPDGTFEKVIAPKWLWAGKVGYVFPNGQKIRLLRQVRTSDWSSIRGNRLYGRTEPVTHHYATAVIEHDPHARTYTYIFVPNVPAEEMGRLAARLAGRYAISNCGPHHVSATDGSVESVVLWEKGYLGKIRADRGCMLLRAGQTWWAVDPARGESPLAVDLGDHPCPLSPRDGRPARVQ